MRFAIEEPEIFLHPHAQRSLATLFDELAEQGSQIFYSTHSSDFIHVERFDRICLVEKCDDSGELCTHVKQVMPPDLAQLRQQLHPSISITEQGLRERYRRICGLEHNEAFFANKILLVEGETEAFAFPIYAHSLGYDLDSNGISIVNAVGKTNLDALYHLYTAFGIPVYVIFDNDPGGDAKDLKYNAVLLRMLGEAEMTIPDGVVKSHFAIIEGNFEDKMKAELETMQLDLYSTLRADAQQQLGIRGDSGKGLIARYMALRLTSENLIPSFIVQVIDALHHLDERSPSTNDQLDEVLLESPTFDFGEAEPEYEVDDIPF